MRILKMQKGISMIAVIVALVFLVLMGMNFASKQAALEKQAISAVAHQKDEAEAKQSATLRSDAVSCSDFSRYLERQGFGYMERIDMQQKARATGQCYWLGDK